MFPYDERQLQRPKKLYYYIHVGFTQEPWNKKYPYTLSQTFIFLYIALNLKTTHIPVIFKPWSNKWIIRKWIGE